MVSYISALTLAPTTAGSSKVIGILELLATVPIGPALQVMVGAGVKGGGEGWG